METESAYGFQDLFASVLSDMARAISQRSGESEQQQFVRCQTAVHMVMGFLPRDVTEVMLAGHCVILHEVMVAEVRDSLRDEAPSNRRTLIALNKAFNDNLIRLERYQQRPAEGRRDQPEAPADENIPATAAYPDDKPVASHLDDKPVAAHPDDKPAAATMNRAARRQAARAESRATVMAARAASQNSRRFHPEGSLIASPKHALPPEDMIGHLAARESAVPAAA